MCFAYSKTPVTLHPFFKKKNLKYKFNRQNFIFYYKRFCLKLSLIFISDSILYQRLNIGLCQRVRQVSDISDILMFIGERTRPLSVSNRFRFKRYIQKSILSKHFFLHIIYVFTKVFSYINTSELVLGFFTAFFEIICSHFFFIHF